MANDNNGMVQVAKAELDTLNAIKAMMDKGWKGKRGAEFRKLLKEENPDLSIPEDIADDIAKPVLAKVDETANQVKTFGERLDKFLNEFKDREDTASLRSDLGAAQKKFGLDDEGLNKVIQRMKDKNNPDVEAAAAWVASQVPKPQPVADHGIQSVSADLFGTTKKEDAYAELHTGGDPFKPGGWFDQQAIKILNEPAEQAA